MTEQLFRDAPTVELLQWLARGSLKQNLPRAARLWGWLQFLYGSERDKLASEPFTYADCRDAFFTASHPKGEEIPPLHDPECRCALITASWLFNEETNLLEQEWRQSLEQHGSVPENLDELLQERLFGITRRSLAADLKILADMGWLIRKKHRYCRVQNWPTRPISQRDNRAPRIATALAGRMAAAWEFDDAQTAELMLLRFQQSYHRRYLEEMSFPDRFEPVSYEEATHLIQQNAQSSDRDTLLAILRERSPEDIYYKVYYPVGDTDVLTRIALWRPFVEILLPNTMRQAIADDIYNEYQFYHKSS